MDADPAALVINATGVIIHTNLGRAPLSAEAIEAMTAVAAGYSDLEYNLERGERGSRLDAVEDLLKRVTGAEAAFVVNNNAGATLLALSALASGKGALISRGQLVEIGGGFRVPDVMEQSGAKLIEVGTTNRTHRRDYEMALVTKDVAAIVRAHSSNFRTIGFTTEVPLVRTGRTRQLEEHPADRRSRQRGAARYGAVRFGARTDGAGIGGGGRARHLLQRR